MNKKNIPLIHNSTRGIFLKKETDNMIKKNFSIRINREKWGRGANSPGELWSEKLEVGCCLGHAMRQITHCSWKSLEDAAFPSHLDKNFKVGSLTYNLESIEDSASIINDDPDMDGKKIENKLKKLFNTVGFKLEFYN